MNAIVKRASSLALIVTAAACATVSVSYSDIAPGTQAVTAESSKFNFLGLTPTPIERIYALRDDLRQQCGGREVTGIVARSSTVYAIIGVVEKTQVAGYCAP